MSKKFVLEVIVRFSDRIVPYDRFKIESNDLFLLCARLNNMKKAESKVPIEQDFREKRRLKKLAEEHNHPTYPCKLGKTGKYSCGAIA